MENTLTIPLPPFPPCGPDEKWERVTEGNTEPGDFFVGHRNEWCGPMEAGAGSPVSAFLCVIRRVKLDPRDARIAWLTAQLIEADKRGDEFKMRYDQAREDGLASGQRISDLEADRDFWKGEAERLDGLRAQKALRVQVLESDVVKLRQLLIDEVCLRLCATRMGVRPSGPTPAPRGAISLAFTGVWSGAEWVEVRSPEGRAILREGHGAEAEKIVAEMLGVAK